MSTPHYATCSLSTRSSSSYSPHPSVSALVVRLGFFVCSFVACLTSHYAAMGGFPPLALTLLSDLFHAVSVILMVVCLAVGGSKPTDNFSWSVGNATHLNSAQEQHAEGCLHNPILHTPCSRRLFSSFSASSFQAASKHRACLTSLHFSLLSSAVDASC